MRFLRPSPLITRPKVSVVVPCYNYGHFLPAAVGSVLDQDGVDLEVIIVDDASPDGSVRVARELASRHEQVRVIEHARNKGHIATYNDGLREVKGEYVVLLSADDALPRNSLTRAVALMEAHPSVGLVFGFPQNFTDELPALDEHVRSWTVWEGGRWFRRACRTGRNVIMNPEVVMRRAAWDEAGEYDARLPHAADMALWLNTALRWDIGRVNGPTQGLYRVHGDNMHLTDFNGMLADLRQRELVFDLLFTEAGPLPADAEELRTASRQALARTALRVAIADGYEAEPDAAHHLADFAQELWPEVTRTAYWRRWLRESAHGAGPGVRAHRRVRASVEWRRWRRYGL